MGRPTHTATHIWGNYIGTRTDGITGRGNSSNGITLDLHSDTFIGTNGDGNNDINEGNLVSDNSQGIQIRNANNNFCLLYTSPSPRDLSTSRMPSSA